MLHALRRLPRLGVGTITAFRRNELGVSEAFADNSTQGENESALIAIFVFALVESERLLIAIPEQMKDQTRANERIPKLLEIPAKVRFLSCEPLLGPVQICKGCPGCPNDCWWQPYGNGYGIHWVIVGGESGHGKRPMQLEWARSLRDQCAAANVPFFMKQIDKVQPIPDELMVRQFPE